MLSRVHGVFRRLTAADCLKIGRRPWFTVLWRHGLATFSILSSATESAHSASRRSSSLFSSVAMVTLPHLIGMRAAGGSSSLLVIKSAQERLARLGLITRVVPDDKLAVALGQLARKLQR